MNKAPTPQVCSSCNNEFGCGARLEGCWCSEVKLTEWQSELVRAKFADCLCQTCLAAFARKTAIKLTLPNGTSEIIEDAVRVDTQNFHEGMFDFYDERGTLLKQVDMGADISWEYLGAESPG